MEDGDADVVLVGAGPAALFAVFQLGLYGLKCRLVDSLDRAGGQCAVLYPDKPIHDVPGFPSIDGLALTARLLEQIAPFSPAFSFGRTVLAVAQRPDGRFAIPLDGGGTLSASVVVVATGLGRFGADGALEAGPAADWPFERAGDAFRVDAETFETSQPGVFAIGDACRYPGKLRLILSGFHEAALMTQAVRRICFPGGRTALEYTTSSSRLKKRIGKAAAPQE
ncbi:NAD(P)/FAD-dependent oxidoreductase [Shinella pollutisoli]|uniref:NAD(P)/FAD-dependent oxidoreductase n=1 Tax=Shinella pollutisoli TaxID=2250594 RepID=A0ABV7DF20_9HYPH|nr:NAD(P)/FAD-dependent oxidoreductase [Shinella pollutisoli]